MTIDELNTSREYLPMVQQRTTQDIIKPSGESFSDTIKELISDVNSLQVESGNLTESLVKGEPVDIHDVMIASEKAKTSFQLLMELRNKFADLYREVQRIQV